MKGGRILAASAAFFLLVTACAPRPKTVAVVTSPTPSPSPTPTAPLAAAGPTFHVGEVGVVYSPVGFTATGGVAPYRYTVVAGALPGGLSLGVDGSISGTPTVGGTFAFTVEVADSGDSTTKVDGKIAIAAHLAASLIPACAQYCNVELGCVTACGNFGTLTGGVGPYAFTVASGPLPAGTSLNGLSLTGTFTGQTGWLQFTVQATDALGATTTISPKFWMYAHISLASGTCYSTFYPFPCSTSLAITGGIPGTSSSVTIASASGSLCTLGVTGGWVCKPTSSPPPMFAASVGNGVVNVSVPGQPNNPFEYSGTVTLSLADQDTCGQGVRCSATATVQVTFAGG